MENQIVELMKSAKFNGESIGNFAKLISKELTVDMKRAYEMLNESIKRGEIFLEKASEKVFLPEKLGLKLGKIHIHKNGFGFVTLDGFDDDVFVPRAFVGRALHNDMVFVKIEKDRYNETKNVAVVKDIVSHSFQNIVGRVASVGKGRVLVETDNPSYPTMEVPNEFRLDAAVDDKVVCRIKDYDYKMPRAEIIEVLGTSFKPEVEVLAIARSFGLEEKYPEEQQEFAKKIPQEVDATEMLKRHDLRSLQIITIDGDDSKDLDDAISLSKNEDGTWHLGVHIADVGHYVPKNGVLDEEAFIRATSVYFPRYVYPMLPVELSNGICSLNPQVPRLALSVFMDINDKGIVVNHEIMESVIESNERMTYKNVQKILDNDTEMCERYEYLVTMIKNMSELSNILSKMRLDRGMINFELRETKFELDSTNEVLELKEYPYLHSNEIIESFMIVANEVVAEHFCKIQAPFVYRVHEKPDIERLDKFMKFLGQYGVQFKQKGAKLTSKDMQDLFNEIQDKEFAPVVRKVALRTMKKAKYMPQCEGHFAINAPFYCHFTSPIRRYPDLEIHRIIKDYLHGDLKDGRHKMWSSDVNSASKQSSERERNADEAERAVDNYFKAKYMEDFIGQEYDALISGLSEQKIWVELDNTAEGFIKVESLPRDTYFYNDELLQLNGQHHKFRMGDKVRVKLVSVNTITREVIFDLIF